jgi:hypothetical protein
MPVNVQAKLNFGSFGAKAVSKPAKKAASQAKKVAAPVKKAVTQVKKAASAAGGTRMGGVGYRKYEGDALWLPNTSRPEWLDGSLPGVHWAAICPAVAACCRATR